MEQDRKSTLSELTNKSWNLELIISGAAIVLLTYLPDLTEKQFNYFHFNLTDQWVGAGSYHLVVLAYAFFKTVSWLLLGMFVLHLVIRAFWVAMIGLQAAYPEGIRYEKLPNMLPVLRKLMEQRFGRLDDYIIRLDRLCNQILALAFLLALMGVMIGIVYNFIFLGSQILKTFLSDSVFQRLAQVLSGLVFLMLAAMVFSNYLLKNRPETAERYGKVLLFFSDFFRNMFMPIIGRPLSYLNFVFMSNMPVKRFYTTTMVFFIGIMGLAITVFMQKIGELRALHFFSWQQYSASGSPYSELLASRYDNLRSQSNQIALVSIPSDIVEGPFLKAFMVYPKMLDKRLAGFCPLPDLPDSLPPFERRRQMDSLKLQCFGSFFRIYVNDSLYAQPDLLFHQKPDLGVSGLLAYLPTTRFRQGKNLLCVKIPSQNKPDSLELFGAAPFWFVESK